ncbi:M14 family metallopeptidase [Anoxybacillus sp. D401a]|uniref:M14 family metallopeptidase n=1 Tax=Anoxybacillus sp. D401a TaxID=575112 RepID=UPI003D356A64
MNRLQLFFMAFLCVFTFIFFHHVVVHANESFVQTIEETNIYKKQQDTYVKVGSLRTGEQLKVSASDDDTYYQIKVGEETCYVEKTSVEEIDTPDYSLFMDKENKTYYRMYTIKETTLYYGTEQQELGTIGKELSFSMIADEGNMYTVIVAGRIAFVDKESVEFAFPSQSPTFEVAVENVPVYVNKNGKWTKVGTLKKGNVLYRKREYERKWHEIPFGQMLGYVPKVGTKPTDIMFKPTSPYPFTHLIATKEKTVIYSEANGSNPILQMDDKHVWLAKGTVNNMYKIVLGGKVAYVPKLHISETINGDGVVLPNQAYTYERLVKDVTRLQMFYPDLIQVQIIGQSVEGRNIYAIKLGKGSKEIFMNASHHAREHITTNVLMEMLDTYAFAYTSLTKVDQYDARTILDRTSIWFVPMVNPDGVTLVQKGHTAVKNGALALAINKGKRDFSAWKANVRGVDLNRQYDARWATIRSNPGKPAPKNYKGSKPFSEPEAQAMRQFTLARNFEITVSYHSSGQIIFWHFLQPKEHVYRDQRLASMLSKQTGYSLVKPVQNPSGGGYKDWFVSQFKKPGFTIEVAPYVGERPVPLKLFPSIWNKNKPVGLMMANEVK